MTSEAVRIFPKASELNKILNNLECPEEECTEVFQNTPNLTLHLLKTHGKERSLKSAIYGHKVAEYYCPEIGCKYCFNPTVNEGTTNSKFSNRYFTQFKYLKQHYIKVHLDKTFICDKCNKGFPTELHRSRHHEKCGNKYTCSCGIVYSSLASLQTHARREQHQYNKDYTKGQNNRSRKSAAVTVDPTNIVKHSQYENNNNTINSSYNLLKLPTGSNILIIRGLVKIVKKEDDEGKCDNVSVSTQTDILPKRRKALSPVKSIIDKPIKKRTSKQTQTGEKQPKKTTETQTIYQCITNDEKRKNTKINVTGRKRKKSMETQTLNNSNSTIVKNEFSYSCATDCITNPKTDEDSNSLDNSITQKDICLPQLWLRMENETTAKEITTSKEEFIYSKDTNNDNKISKIINDSGLDINGKSNYNSLTFYNQEVEEVFNKEILTKESSSCHIETQTDNGISSIFDEYLSGFDGTNNNNGEDSLDQYTRYTQTCDDILLPDDMVLDFTNNETQTAWSLCDDSFMSEVVNSETQTPFSM